jgi:hypothetical protein
MREFYVNFLVLSRFTALVTFDTFRQLLLAPAVGDTLAQLGWSRASEGPPPHDHAYYLVVGLCELTGAVLRGTGVYEPDGRWVNTDLDSGLPRSSPATAWCFLDPALGCLVMNKEVYYYKPCPLALRDILVYPWMNFAPLT